MKFDICVWGYVFPNIEAGSYEMAKRKACDLYKDKTNIEADPNDNHVVWKQSGVYPYIWK